MPKVIFKCRHFRADVVNQRATYTHYISTRTGAEAPKRARSQMLASKRQIELIENLLTTYPDSAELFEYEDYLKHPSMENASEYITQALEHNYNDALGRESYVSYLATRPGVEKQGEHGLFCGNSDAVSLARAKEEIAKHPGVVWMPIISLHREDAARLGYDNADNWKVLLKSISNDFAKKLKIPPKDFAWYAAFHNEGHHPHIHMVCYSKNPEYGFLTVSGIRSIKSMLTANIFRDELNEIYSQQTKYRSSTQAEAENQLKECIAKIGKGHITEPRIFELMSLLAEKLKYHSGKKQYGYLRPPVKKIVDEIVCELGKNEKVAAAYEKWCEARKEILLGYRDEIEDIPPLHENNVFKPVRNMVVKEAAAMLDMLEEMKNSYIPADANLPNITEPDIDTGAINIDDTQDAKPAEENPPYVKWTERYKRALEFLYGTKTDAPDFEEAYLLLEEEAAAGNALAMHDLGRMCKDGLWVEASEEKSYEWYAKSLTAFKTAESEKPGRYVQYRIGKMYNAGLGTQQDYEEAAKWFSLSAGKGYKYAQYSLARLYYDGTGAEQDYSKAYSLYHQSAAQSFPYAAFECGKMCRDGIGAAVNESLAGRYFEDAYQGFCILENERSDDKLQYCIGQMLFTGMGTEKNIPLAEEYFEKAARLGNAFAQYQLAKLIFLEETPAPERFDTALEWMLKSAESGNENAWYALAKLYLENEQLRDISKALHWFTKSADAGNQYAQYRLGMLYLLGEEVTQNTEKAEKLLTASAEQGNEYAAYQLGKLYIGGEHRPENIERGLYWLNIAAEKENDYAQYAIGKYFLFSNDEHKNEEQAIYWLMRSATNGNIYATALLEKIDEWKRESIYSASGMLLSGVAKIFTDTPPTYKLFPKSSPVDKKRIQQLLEKKQSRDIHFEENHYTV